MSSKTPSLIPRLSKQFGSLVFDAAAQELFLPKKIVLHLEEVKKGAARFDSNYADLVAEGLRHWAVKHGATHYTHWFQPLSGNAAGKHDSFLSWDAKQGAMGRLKGKELLFGEPDASSFPSGGLRATHEARGYTAWDTASSPFLWEGADGLTLCIPSVFYSWKGEALDYKLPLLRSDQKLEQAALRLLSFCKEPAKTVFSTLGAEQEYFLLDRELFDLRPDLVLAGRTIFGAKPSKGQELEDHYFGAIPERVLAFIRDFEFEATQLGIPLKTRHNEVAPRQFEVAPLFEKASLACDHNVLLMELMDKLATRHHLACLFHEKPFASINGSGKHNNWSLATEDGRNLLNPKENSLVFLALLAAVLRGVAEHAALLRASIGSASNDHRLGGSEAPPTIFSVFLGSVLEQLVVDIAQGRGQKESLIRNIDLGLRHLNLHEADPSDRNRTSFFAFTGNKFEFRAVGSSASCAWPITIINAVVADSLSLVVDELEDAIKDQKGLSEKKRLEICLPVLRKHFAAALPVLFSGNGYSEEWVQEAASRGLPNIRKSFHSFEHLHSKKTIRIFEGILNEHELESRAEIAYERYAKEMNIETNLALDLFQTLILPAVQRDLGSRASSLREMGKMGIESKLQIESLGEMNRNLEEAMELALQLSRLQKQTADLGWEAKGKVFCELIGPKLEELRRKVDGLEAVVESDLWPLPKYQELLF